jgi:hypothetical protein
MLVLPGEELDFINAAVDLATNTRRQQQFRQAAPASVAQLGWDVIYDTFVETLSGVLDRQGRQFASGFSPLRPSVAIHPSA